MTLDRGDVQVKQTKMPLPKMEMHLRNGDITLTLPEKAAFELGRPHRPGRSRKRIWKPVSSALRRPRRHG